MPECLMRIPLFFSGSSAVVAQTRDELVSIVDLLPTLCEVVGQPIPPGVQGRSLAPLLRGEPSPPGEFDSIYAERGYGGMTAAAADRPELHFPYEGRSFDELNAMTQSGRTTMLRYRNDKLLAHRDGRGELCDLDADPNRGGQPLRRPSVRLGARGAQLASGAVEAPRAHDLPIGEYAVRTAKHNWADATDGPTRPHPD